MTQDYKLFFDNPVSLEEQFAILAKKNPSRLYAFKCGKVGVTVVYNGQTGKYDVKYRGFSPKCDGVPETPSYLTFNTWISTPNPFKAATSFLNLVELACSTASSVSLLTLDFGD